MSHRSWALRRTTTRAGVASAIALAIAGCGSARHTMGHTLRDRPDDYGGRQIHFVYAVPGGRSELDHHRDTDGTLAASTVLLVAWFRQQAGRPILAVDSYKGRPDITFVRLSRTDQAYERAGPAVLAADVHQRVPLPRDKLYAIYYDGTLPAAQTEVCGMGRGDHGRFAIVFLAQGCFDSYDLSEASAVAYNRFVFVMAHELVHELGFVPECASHATDTGHVDDSRRDLMYPVLGNKVPTLDVNHDDYYLAQIRGCPDLSRSPYLHGPRSLLHLTP
jgi:hypothetical protein